MSESTPEPQATPAPKAEPLNVRPAVYDVIEKGDKQEGGESR